MADCVSKQCYTGRPGHLLITIAINTHHCIRICIVYSRLKSIGHTTAAVHQYCTLCTVRRVLCPVYTYSIHYYVQLLLLARVRRCLQLRLNFNSTALQPFSMLCITNAIEIPPPSSSLLKSHVPFFPAVVVYWSYTLSGDYL